MKPAQWQQVRAELARRQAEAERLAHEAREQAMRDAKARADLLAKAGGATVGEVLIITENLGSAVPLPMVTSRSAIAQDSASVPVQPGEQTIAIDVQVTYALK